VLCFFRCGLRGSWFFFRLEVAWDSFSDINAGGGFFGDFIVPSP